MNMSSTDYIPPQIMGILNLTTDSFSDGGKWLNSNDALQHAMKMLEEGAQIIDIGAESTRPGSMPISAELEWSRIEPVLNSLSRQNIHCKVSVDTQKSYVAERSIAAGATMINDISALEYDPEMLQVLKQHQDVELVIMHKQGNPETMQINPQYDDVVTDVKDYLISRLEYLEQHGINRDRIYLDPGIGFGKTLDHNLEILANLDLYQGYKLLLGASRKSFIDKIQPADPQSRLGGSLAAAMYAILAKAAIIRVHDVREHRQFFDVMMAIEKHQRRG